MERPMKTEQTPSPERPAVRPRIRRILNLRVLVETLIVAAIIGPAVYFWYAYQVKRTADAMLERAQNLVEEKDDAAAAQYYFQYLKLKPGDADAQVLLAETFDRAAKGWAEKPQAVEYYYQALGVAPTEKQRGLHQRLAELLIELRRFTSAEEEARELLKRDSEDVQGHRLLALALHGQSRSGSLSGGKDLSAVGEAVERAWKLNPGDVELAVILADIFRNQPQLFSQEQQGLSEAECETLADQVMNEMVAAKPKDAKALLARHRYQLRYHPADPQKGLAKAIQENPDDLAVVLQAAAEARLAAEKARWGGGSPADVQVHMDQARKHYEHAIEISPSKEPAYLSLAELYVREGKLDLAVKTLRDGLEKAGRESIPLNSSLADVLLAQGQLDEADKTIAGLEGTAERIAPIQPQPVKLALKRMIDSLRGRWLMSKGRYLEAVNVLRRVAVGQGTTAVEIAQSMQAWLWLGRTYAALGQWDQAAIAFERAAVLEPKAVSPHLGAARAWAAANRSDAAERHYRQALSMDPSAETWLALARVLFQRQLRLPKGTRNWDSFNKALAEAKKPNDKKSLADAWRLKLLEADCLTARAEEPAQREQSIHDAVALCREAEREYPDAVGLLPPLAAAYERFDRPAETDRILKRLEAVKGQEAAACLLRARFCAGRKQYEQARKVLTAGLESLPEQVRPAVRQELVQLALREGRTDQALEQLLKLHQAEPANLGPLIQLAEMAFETGKLSEVEQWEKELRKLEGDNGLFWQYYRARRLLAEATGPADAKLVEASKLQAFVQTQRPTWSRAYLLQGLLSEARGKYDQAAEAYQEAIHLGERQPLAYQRLISLLLQTNQIDEADHYLSLMQGQAVPSASYSPLESIVAARRGQIDRALESARRGAEQQPTNPLAHLWLGQMLLAAEKTSDAETALKKAIELAPDDPRTLGGLFVFYIRTERPDEARATLQKVVKNEKIEKLQRASILAQGYELLGDKEQADAHYREAALLDVENGAAQVRLAGYLLRTGTAEDRSEPERLLRGVLRQSPDFRPARRMLAQLLVERGGQQAWQEACRLVEEAGKDGSISNVDRRLQAMILSRRGGKENLDKARQILEELVADPKKADVVDRRQLARLYEAGGKVEAVRQQYLKLFSRKNATTADMVAFVLLLLRHDLFDEADAWLKKLEATQPDDLGTGALRAHWLRGKGQTAKIEPLLEPLAEKIVERLPKNSLEEANHLLAVGNLYSALEQHQAAERWNRRLVALRPERYPPLVGSLARQGRMREAIELCDAAAKSDASALPATTAALALLAGKPSDDDFALAEPLLAKAAADHKDDVDFLTVLASVRVVQQRLDEATGLFRQALTLKPDNVSTLNNLATLLSEQPENRKEALRYIDRAIEILGPQPGLLDTKGMILVFENKPGDAVPLLEQAAASPLTDPRYHFHLAVAYDRAGQPEKARAAFHTARKNHLTRQVLTPLDLQILQELKKKFD